MLFVSGKIFHKFAGTSLFHFIGPGQSTFTEETLISLKRLKLATYLNGFGHTCLEFYKMIV